jgi:hypothetical protein
MGTERASFTTNVCGKLDGNQKKKSTHMQARSLARAGRALRVTWQLLLAASAESHGAKGCTPPNAPCFRQPSTPVLALAKAPGTNSQTSMPYY